MTATLESAGGIVLKRSFKTRKLDALSQWVTPTPPVFLINSDATVDRQRFTLAHELGHLVMHRCPTMDMEAEADRFAAEFLMPASDIKEDLLFLRPNQLHSLKLSWRTSMASIIRRARDLGCITQAQYTSMFKLLSKSGYRISEPEILAPEEPTVLGELFDVHRQDLGYSTDDLAKMLRINRDRLYELYGQGQVSLRIVQRAASAS